MEQKDAILEEAVQALDNDFIDESQPAILAALVGIYAQAGNRVKAAEMGRDLYKSGYRHPDFIEALKKAAIQL